MVLFNVAIQSFALTKSLSANITLMRPFFQWDFTSLISEYFSTKFTNIFGSKCRCLVTNNTLKCFLANILQFNRWIRIHNFQIWFVHFHEVLEEKSIEFIYEPLMFYVDIIATCLETFQSTIHIHISYGSLYGNLSLLLKRTSWNKCHNWKKLHCV